jgi:phage/plasmid-like protein (TIGR03299 family)
VFLDGLHSFPTRRIKMAHELATTNDMAFIGDTPWHGLGNQLPRNQPLEVWQRVAGMDWDIKQTEVLFNSASGDGSNMLNLRLNKDATVLYRSDNHEPLSVVSKRYKVVQPKEVLGFYRDLVSVGGFELETAGILKGGKKLWALAKTGQEAMLAGGDKVKAYLLLATSCDGSLATTAQFTSIRVVCNNTLQMAVGESKGAIRVPHSTMFNADEVKRELGLGVTAWDQFMVSIKALSNRPVNKFEAMSYLVNVLGDASLPLNEQPNQKAIQTVYGLYAGEGKGSKLTSANGTAWGLVNGVTEYVDSLRRARSQDNRLDSAWFGTGAALKQKGFEAALALAA